jgi:hypothetical protein
MRDNRLQNKLDDMSQEEKQDRLSLESMIGR